MREWPIIAVGLAIGLTIGNVIGATFELSQVVAKIVAFGGAFFSVCLAVGIATMARWVKSPRESLIIVVGLVIGGTIGITIGEVFELSQFATRIVAIGSGFFCAWLTLATATMAGWVNPLSDNA